MRCIPFAAFIGFLMIITAVNKVMVDRDIKRVCELSHSADVCFQALNR